MKRKLPYCILISLILTTPFIYSNDLYNGLISAKQLWFYGTVSILILVFGIDLLFRTKYALFSLNLIDIALLTFYTYFFIRSAFTPYTPLLYNTKFLNISLLVIMYFIIKELIVSSKNPLAFLHPDRKPEAGSRKQKLFSGLRSFDSGLLASIIIHLLIITGLIQAIWGLLQLYGMTKSFHSGFKITGTFFNPAPYAIYLAAIFPLALGTLLQMKEIKNERVKELKIEELNNLGNPQYYTRIFQFFHSFISSFFHYITPSLLIRKLTYYISLLTVISIILVLPATMIRASWLGVLAGSLVVLNYSYNLLKKTLAILTTQARKVFVIACAILITVLSVTGLYFLKKGSSTGKLLIWEVTVGKIIEKPLFGHGTGRVEAEYNNWQAEYFQQHPEEMDGQKGMAAGNTKCCFNEYLEMASELGLIGLLLFLTVIPSVVFGIKNGILKTITVTDSHWIPSRESLPRFGRGQGVGLSGYECHTIPMTLIILIPPLVSLLVMAMISFPFYSLPTLIVFFFLAAIISSRVTTGFFLVKEKINFSFPRLYRFVIFLVLVPFSALLLMFTRQQYKAYYTYDEAVMLYQTSIYTEACKSFSEAYDPLKYSGSYLQYYGKALNMNQEYPQSLEMLESATHFTSDEILYTTLGDTYKALKRYSEAEEAYLHASFMVPHKLYPLYLLAILYDETGQREKAVDVAEEVQSKAIKVESEASDEIRLKMKSIIEKEK